MLMVVGRGEREPSEIPNGPLSAIVRAGAGIVAGNVEHRFEIIEGSSVGVMRSVWTACGGCPGHRDRRYTRWFSWSGRTMCDGMTKVSASLSKAEPLCYYQQLSGS